MIDDPAPTHASVYPVLEAGSGSTHLRLHRAETTLCGLPIETPSSARNFQRSGCLQCGALALDDGVEAIQEEGVTVNLGRAVVRQLHRKPD